MRLSDSVTIRAFVFEHRRERLGERGGHTGRLIIWGVAENKVEYPLRMRDETQGVLAADLGVGADGIQVAAQRGERAPVAFDEERRLRTARQSLDPERAGARVEVEHACAGHVSEDREERLADAVRGGTRARRHGARAAAGP